MSTVSYNVVNSINSAHSWEIFPCIIKPADSYGQRGITLVKSEKELNKVLENALNHSESSHAIIEPYLEGVEISTNVIVQNGEIIINEFTERLVHPLPLLGIPYGHAIPVRSVGEDDLKKAEKIVESLVESLKIENAVLYIQLKVTADGPKIIEVAPRLDGCHLWRLIKQAKGYDLRKYAIDLLIGKKIETDDAGSDKSEKTVLKFHQIKSGERFSAQKLDIPDDVLFNEYRYNENEKVKAVNGKLEVVGYYINRG